MVPGYRSARFLLIALLALSLLAACSSGADGRASDNTAEADPPVSQDTETADTETDGTGTGADASDAVTPTTPLRLMPIGDSITQGWSDRYSYRYPLWKRLIDAGAAIDFVGSLDENYKGNPEWPAYRGLAFDSDHEGHWGWRVDEVLAEVDTWLAANTPDIVLLHLGTNDIFQSNGVESTLAELSELITRLRAANPQVVVFFAQVIGSTSNDGLLQELNLGIASLAATLNSADSPVYVVDQYSGFDPQADTYDGVHPNSDGEEKMAAVWFEAMAGSGVLQ
ncbi:SGNH/GDSL hydrolase family protein [Granulosicoccaceae sp. 1_MG-2023]|nr:SGNH/GDSL hydrolase family protein [Granulosicoccaceae sp. 1_MG-2023]